MATVKAMYESAIRRFTISSDITWSNLVSQLRDLFQIPNTALINVSYTDEEGDVISVSSDLELQEILSLHSAGKIVRLVITTDSSRNNVLGEIGKATKEVLEQLSIEENETIDESKRANKSKEEVKQTNTSGESSSPNVTEDEPTIIVIRLSHPWCRSSFGGRRHFRYHGQSFYQPYIINRPHCSFEDPSHCQSSSREQEFGDYGRGPRCYEYHRQKQNISSEQLAEGLKTLNFMGFPSDDKKYEKLLRQYNGNIGRVIDILLEEQGDGSKEKQEVRPESSTSVMMEVDAEKNKERPYVLHE
ncbi:7687_t:CDS:1 [Acaulospora colombiana]|uniref:7687_t:CDS:1 n=1 Tax=Acaulospora colombiana TaxID=27376 RepID=A0ACA9K4A3_9GLOM|nr:7687_t:CDS:1 [Acaulospora colombiana]